MTMNTCGRPASSRTRVGNFAIRLHRYGLEFVPSAANFVLVRVGDGDKVFEALLRRGLIVRAMCRFPNGFVFLWEQWIKIGASSQLERLNSEGLLENQTHQTAGA